MCGTTNLGIVHVLEGRPQDGIAVFQRALDVATRIGSTYLALGCLDGMAAAMSHKQSETPGSPFRCKRRLTSTRWSAKVGGEQALYQPYIDALKGALTREEMAR